MANLCQAVLCSMLPAPRRQTLVLEATMLTPKRPMQENRRKASFVTVACSDKHASRPPSGGTRAISSCSEYNEGMLEARNTVQVNTERESRIRKHLKMENPEYFPSAYDTAWVAMVPLPGSNPEAPCFPQCVEWILQNQHDNGSWGPDEFAVSVKKDIFLSTLACVLALKKWNVGSDQTERGLQFLEMNLSIIMDEKSDALIDFNLTVTALVSLANRMYLQSAASERSIQGILHLSEMVQKRLVGEKCSGNVSLLEGNMVMKMQRKNGSLFNSPAATAAALVHHYHDTALNYLDSAVNMFGSAVPAVYPMSIDFQLSMVDILENVGISRHFSSEIKTVLDKTYMFWSQRDEEVMFDMATCAMAFRLLRMNGYHVFSEELSHAVEGYTFCNSVEGYLDDIETLLELYKASKVSLSENEQTLEKICSWSGHILNEKLCSDSNQNIELFGEVEYALKFPFYATVDLLHHKRNIENLQATVSQKHQYQILPWHVYQDVLALAIEDFSLSQSAYRAELKQLKSWEKENKLDQLEFVRKNLTNSYLAAAATINTQELSDARIACAKSIALTLIADDLFDVGGSKEDLENLMSLVEKWDQHQEVEFYSEHVKVVFSALYSTVNQLGAKASVAQNRDVTKYIVELWLHYLRSLSTEAEWQRNKYVPTMEEYLTNAVVGYALGPITLMSLYFLGQNPWEDILKGQECNELCRLSSTCGRLLNDTQTFERECKDGKLNSVSLLILQSGGSMPIEAAKEVIRESIASYRRKLFRLFLIDDGLIPRPGREMWWRFYKTSHVFYSQSDEYSSPKEMMAALKAVITEPL